MWGQNFWGPMMQRLQGQRGGMHGQRPMQGGFQGWGGGQERPGMAQAGPMGGRLLFGQGGAGPQTMQLRPEQAQPRGMQDPQQAAAINAQAQQNNANAAQAQSQADANAAMLANREAQARALAAQRGY